VKSVVMLLLWLLVAPVWSDVAVQPEAQRLRMEQELERETKGLAPAQQHAKVEQMLREKRKQRNGLAGAAASPPT